MGRSPSSVYISEVLFFSKGTSAVHRYLYARDLAFFCLVFFSGDRGSDLGRIFTKEIVCLPDGDGFLFRHTFGKTLRGDGKTNQFMIKECPNPKICPVANLKLYVKLCDLMGVNLREGYLFRVLNSKSEVSEDPFVGSAVANRLASHLRASMLTRAFSDKNDMRNLFLAFPQLLVLVRDPSNNALPAPVKALWGYSC